MSEVSKVLNRYIAKDDEPKVVKADEPNARALILRELDQMSAQLSQLETCIILVKTLQGVEASLLLVEARLLVTLFERTGEQPKKKNKIETVADFEAAFLGRPH